MLTLCPYCPPGKILEFKTPSEVFFGKIANSYSVANMSVALTT